MVKNENRLLFTGWERISESILKNASHFAFLLQENPHTYTRAARLPRIFQKKLPAVLLHHKLCHIKADAKMPAPTAAFVSGKKLLCGVF